MVEDALRPPGRGRVLPADVAGKYTPVAGWPQAVAYNRDVLRAASGARSMGDGLSGEASVATNGLPTAPAIATTLKVPMLIHVEDNGLGI